jgi:hypothetical protein
MLLREDRLIFVHIQKTGGTSINRALGSVDNPIEKHRTASELRLMYGENAWAESYKFSFVRNPWDRLVSWWSMIDGNRAHIDLATTPNRFFKYVLQNAFSFEEFICNCHEEISDGDGVKGIFRNQIDYLTDSDGYLMVDFVGRFENLAEDFATVSQHVYGQTKPLPHSNKSQHGVYQNYYSQHTRTIVEEAYRADILHFGYQFE